MRNSACGVRNESAADFACKLFCIRHPAFRVRMAAELFWSRRDA